MSFREIKAFVRRARIDSVIYKLRAMGFKSISVIAVDGVGSFVNPSDDRLSPKYVMNFSRVYKIELACRDEDEDEIVRLIGREAHSGEAGDGMIFVSDVERAVKIRTGREGPDVVERPTMSDKE
ncbi:MAG: hypothetical protein GTO51_07670 [Candidatus Latescibacteria bacterium]|nr:hypothetical protein [Candidatus Latescibacterota bacterium]NIO29242.1 hypothetical protein [Candidatus Latescibacterota bacterium]NIO56866.1 hypothetical protein [Candidatus Latescibacterota bacterium]